MKKVRTAKTDPKEMDTIKIEDIKELGGDEDDYEMIQRDDDDGDSVELNEDSSDSEDLRNEIQALVNKLGFGKKRKDRDDESEESPVKSAKKSKLSEKPEKVADKSTTKTAAQSNSKAVTDAKTKKESNLKVEAPSNSKAVTDAKTKKESNLKVEAQSNSKTVTNAKTKNESNVKAAAGSKGSAQKPTNADAKASTKVVKKATRSVDFSVKSRKYLLVKAGSWLDHQFVDENVVGESLPKEEVEKLEEFAKKLLDEESSLYKAQHQKKLSESRKKVLMKGTQGDRVAGLWVQVTDSPVHNLASLDNLISLLKMKERRKSLPVLESVQELFIKYILPNRKLKPFAQQPLSHVMELASGNKDTQDKRLIMWCFESQLKQKYENFIKAVEILSHDTVEKVKSKAIATIFHLLRDKPEQEKVLLSLLVNKLGDPVRKVAAKTAHLLTELVKKHPNMKMVITLEVERLLYRSNVTQKAQYYAICFLNQLRLGQGDNELASRLVATYFSFFKAFVSKGEIESKMLSGLLSGVNRAYPFAKVDQEKIAEQYQTLFRLIHFSNFGTSVQALMLLFQIVDVGDSSADRFYMALYRKMLDAELPMSGKLPMFLNLLLKSMKTDLMVPRVQAFMKRILQVAMSCTPAFACSVLLVMSELLKERPKLLVLKKEAEDSEDEEEHFVDVKLEDEEDDTVVNDNASVDDEGPSSPAAKVLPVVHKKNLPEKKTKYDPLHRNPLYCRADLDCAWELRNLANHYHPSVKIFANTILQGQNIDYSSNPLEDFNLANFLDRFARRNPKKSGRLDVDEKEAPEGGSDDEEADVDDSDADVDDDDFDNAIDKFEECVDEY